jgi:flagellar biosynthesis chaperone FliJ
MKNYDSKIKFISYITEPHHKWNNLLSVLKNINEEIQIYYGYQNIKELKQMGNIYIGINSVKFYTNKNLTVEYFSNYINLQINNLTFGINLDNANTINYCERIIGSQSIQMQVQQNFMIEKINKNLIDYINPRIYLDYLSMCYDVTINNIISNQSKKNKIIELETSLTLYVEQMKKKLNQIEKLEKLNAQYKNTIEEKSLAIDDINRQYNNSLNRIEKLEKLNDQCKNTIEEKSLAIDDINRQYNNSLNQIEKLEKLNTQYKNTIEEAIDDINRQYNNSLNQIEKLEKLNDQYKNTIEEKSLAIDDIVAKYDNLLTVKKNRFNKLTIAFIFVTVVIFIIYSFKLTF